MRKLPFKHSAELSLGIELEFQLIDPMTYEMISHAKDLIRSITEDPLKEKIKPEVTQSMIEINSAVHQTPQELMRDLTEIHAFLLVHANKIGIKICGGGAHPFHKWIKQKIFPTKRFKNLSWQYRYLSKRATVFGMHVHIGCSHREDALYLTHALARYVPHFITLSASSPFYQETDTGYQSSRSNEFNAFPLCGVIPYLLNWEEFSAYFYKMRNVGIVKSMKDFYWDIRPKPEFGTVEIRVFDSPLTIKKAVLIAAYVQVLARYLLKEKPFEPSPDLYFLYRYNRFQAGRYGFEGDLINPIHFQHTAIATDILETINTIEKHAIYFNSVNLLSELKENVINKKNDTSLLRKIFNETANLPKVVREQCIIWEKDNDDITLRQS